MNIIIRSVEQTPHLLLAHLESNLRSSREMEPLRHASNALQQRFRQHGFDDLAALLNIQGFSTAGQQFKWKDFRGCSLYPFPEDVFSYQASHTLPAVSFGISLLAPKWATFQRRAGIPFRSRGHSIEEYLFQPDSLGLEKVGITFHVADGYAESRFYELLLRDIHLYNPAFERVEDLAGSRLPPLIELSLEYKTLRELVGALYEPNGEKILAPYLAHRLSLYREYWIASFDSSRMTDAFVHEARTVFDQITQPAKERIAPAVEAAYALRSQLGMQLIVPVFFSLGSSCEEIDRKTLFSPLKGIVQWRKYIESGELTANHIREVLYRKGYSPVPGVN